MSDYLYNHYKGKYRVLADYDLDTNDFPRDEQGNIDSNFNDFYIPGRKYVQIRHAGRDNLGCYVFSIGVGRNILTDIYEKESTKKPPKKLEPLCEAMVREDIITDYTIYDGEILFIFTAAHLDDWAKIFKLKTSGAKISPLSIKNLPKSDYEIDEADLKKYEEAVASLDRTQKMLIAKSVFGKMTSKMSNAKKAEMRKLGMKPKQYIHYIGKWDDMLKEVQREINNG